MDLGGHTILITGGGSGIGRAFAERFVAAGSRVIACGRRSEALEEAKSAIPGLESIVCDVSREDERVRLFEQVKAEYPDLDVLVNNAGIQNRPPSLLEPQDWSAHRLEIATNLEAPLHLSMLFAPFLAKRERAHIINVTSGLAFVPLAWMPTYCLTKAALHSFTLSLRKQLDKTGVEVIEVAPPAVQTDLGGKGLHDFGEPLDLFADHVMAKLVAGELEFGYKSSEDRRIEDYAGRTATFEKMNG